MKLFLIFLAVAWAGAPCDQVGRYGSSLKCCEGLSARSGHFNAKKECESGGQLYLEPICIACGNKLCEDLENECNCPEDCKPTKERSKVNYSHKYHEPKEDYSERIFLNPYSGPNADTVRFLEEARKSKSEAACKKIPPITPETIHADDYVDLSASSEHWRAFCNAIGSNKISHCKSAGKFEHECTSYFQRVAAKRNSSPEFCLDELGKSLLSSSDGQACIEGWRGKLFGNRSWSDIRDKASDKKFKAKIIEIGICYEGDFKNQAACLYEVAKKYMDKRICTFSSDPRCLKPFQ